VASAAEGLFLPHHLRPIPSLPQRAVAAPGAVVAFGVAGKEVTHRSRNAVIQLARQNKVEMVGKENVTAEVQEITRLVFFEKSEKGESVFLRLEGRPALARARHQMKK